MCIRQCHSRPQHVKFRHAASHGSFLLVGQLLSQQADLLFGDGNQGPLTQGLVKILLHREHNVLNHGVQRSYGFLSLQLRHPEIGGNPAPGKNNLANPRSHVPAPLLGSRKTRLCFKS